MSDKSKMRTLHSTALNTTPSDHAAKPLAYYKIYDQIFTEKNFTPTSYLEIGVHFGDSLRVFTDTYEHCRVVGVDLEPNKAQERIGSKVKVYRSNQTDKRALEDIVAAEFPLGIDLIIDDASHIGINTYKTFEILFPFLRKGGLYFIEDWGTGYWSGWPDGEKYISPTIKKSRKKQWQMQSHDYGMVGVVKSLIDFVHSDAIALDANIDKILKYDFSEVSFYPGICMIRRSVL